MWCFVRCHFPCHERSWNTTPHPSSDASVKTVRTGIRWWKGRFCMQRCWRHPPPERVRWQVRRADPLSGLIARFITLKITLETAEDGDWNGSPGPSAPGILEIPIMIPLPRHFSFLQDPAGGRADCVCSFLRQEGCARNQIQPIPQKNYWLWRVYFGLGLVY